MLTSEIKLDEINQFQEDLNDKKDSKVIERAVSHQGILASSEDFDAESKMDLSFQLTFQLVKLPTKSKVVAAGCLLL